MTTQLLESPGIGEPAGALSAGEAPVRNVLSGAEWSPAGLRDLYRLAAELRQHPERYRGALAGRSLAMIFEKPSLRTRVTFEVGIHNLGGAAVFLDQCQSRLGQREAVGDVARSLEGWVHGIVARTFSHSTVEELAAHVSIPVINGLCDRFHPCQALADFFTLEEHFGPLRGFPMAYVGDGNNVCHSLMLVAARLGVHLRVATPLDYGPDSAVVAEARRAARATRAHFELLSDPREAVQGARAVYTDTWVSMGQEGESAERAPVFAPYQVNAVLLDGAAPDAVFMHCLPAHRGREVTDDVIDSERSLVFQQARNRLPVQCAILLTVLD